jgi:dethiobiotin synthetase
MGRALFITGTGTDIGKSALSLAALLWARRKGLASAYFKPVQCGTFPFGNPPSPHGDADWIAALAGAGLETHVTYRFPDPVSPHLAAERSGNPILADRIREDLENLLDDKDLVIMEGAGGAAVPLDRQGNSLAILAAESEIPCLIACAPGLGTLHHTLSTLAYLGALEAPVAGFAFCHREAAVPEMFEDNRRTLADLTGLPCFGTVPYLAALASGGPFSAADAAAMAQPLTNALDSWWNATPD